MKDFNDAEKDALLAAAEEDIQGARRISLGKLIEALEPLIETDLREKIVKKIESEAGAIVDPRSDYLRGYVSGLKSAVASVQDGSDE